MQYSFTCNCGQVMSAEAENDEEALTKLVEVAKPHLAEVHPEMQMTDEQVTETVKAGMKAA